MKVTSCETHSSSSSTCLNFQNGFFQCNLKHQTPDPRAPTPWLPNTHPSTSPSPIYKVKKNPKWRVCVSVSSEAQNVKEKMKVTSCETHSSRSSTCLDFQNGFLECESNHQTLDPTASTKWSKTLSEVYVCRYYLQRHRVLQILFHIHKWLLSNSSRDQPTFDWRSGWSQVTTLLAKCDHTEIATMAGSSGSTCLQAPSLRHKRSIPPT